MNLQWLKRLLDWRGGRTAAPDASEVDAANEPADPYAEPVELEITAVFDLHTIPPKQVKAVVTEYLFQAHARGFISVRIIHGKGRGVQRELVRALLQRTPFVRCYDDAPPTAGGWGATSAELLPAPDESTDGSGVRHL
ncbi:MAG: Smr/MutS family protein [Acidobacteria bacterium]|nr:Smr/MutS family protein [Acidobacteriota bacterium]MBI3422714.1 Smr/MutS family protein [Acidobacteriota bacterium]